MKNSILIAAANAVLAIAGPVEKRAYVTEVATYYETVTVTEGSEPTPTAGVKQEAQPKVVVVTQTAGAQPAPEPTEEPEQPSVVIVTASPDPTTESPQPTQPAPTTEQVIEAPSSVAVDYPTPSAPSDDDFIGNALYHHNLHRANHSAPELSWDDKIAGYASNTAKTCHFGHDMDQGEGGYGQNIAMWGLSSGAEKLGEAGAIKLATTDYWYNGEFNSFPLDFYGLTNPGGSLDNWGHFTQLIWKATEQLGCAVEFCPDGTMLPGMDTWYMVCNYKPAGNMGGTYAENVLKPLGEAMVLAN